MAQKMTNEQFQEEFAKVDDELKHLQHDLQDTLAMNDDFALSIEEKEAELTKKEARLSMLKEKNIAELQQHELEKDASAEDLKHEIVWHSNTLEYLKTQQDRFNELERSNESLFESIRELIAKTAADNHEHAHNLHVANRDMKDLRQQMENKLRKELNGMNVSYQKDAFGALLESQKKAMFENAKLKDEVALQGVGIVNLGSRLHRQKQAHDKCHKELQQLYKRSKSLREILAEQTMIKNQNHAARLKINSEYIMLSAEKENLVNNVQKAPLINEIKSEIHELKQKIANEDCAVQMWRERIRLFELLYSDLKPVTLLERDGHFSMDTFKLHDTMYNGTSMANATNATNTRTSSLNNTRNNTLQNSSYLPNTESMRNSPLPVLTISTDVNEQPESGMKVSKEIKSANVSVSLQIDTNFDKIKVLPFTETLSPIRVNRRDSENSHTSVGTNATQATGSIKHKDLELMLEKDKYLARALHLIKGKESGILIAKQQDKEKGSKSTQFKPTTAVPAQTNPNSVSEGASHENSVRSPNTDELVLQINSVLAEDEPPEDQNMLAWITLQILAIWQQTAIDCQIETVRRRESITSIHSNYSADENDENDPHTGSHRNSVNSALSGSFQFGPQSATNSVLSMKSEHSGDVIHSTMTAANIMNSAIENESGNNSNRQSSVNSRHLSAAALVAAEEERLKKQVALDSIKLTQALLAKQPSTAGTTSRRGSNVIIYDQLALSTGQNTKANTNANTNANSSNNSQIDENELNNMLSGNFQENSDQPHGANRQVYSVDIEEMSDYSNDLSEQEIEQLWDEAFTMYNDINNNDDNNDNNNYQHCDDGYDTNMTPSSRIRSNTAVIANNTLQWIKKVPEIKRFPTTDYHITGKLASSNNNKNEFSPPTKGVVDVTKKSVTNVCDYVGGNMYAYRLKESFDIGPPIFIATPTTTNTTSVNVVNKQHNVNNNSNSNNKSLSHSQSASIIKKSASPRLGHGVYSTVGNKLIKSMHLDQSINNNSYSQQSPSVDTLNTSNSSLKLPSLIDLSKDPLMGKRSQKVVKNKKFDVQAATEKLQYMHKSQSMSAAVGVVGYDRGIQSMAKSQSGTVNMG